MRRFFTKRNVYFLSSLVFSVLLSACDDNDERKLCDTLSRCTEAGLLEQCKDGLWTARYCAPGFSCEGDQCVGAKPCAEGSTRCEGHGVKVSCEGGKEIARYCDAGQECLNGECKDLENPAPTCTEGSAHCGDSGVRVVCEAGKEMASYCDANQICVDAACKDLEQLKCDTDTAPICYNGGVASCGADGKFIKTPCPEEKPVCFKGECVECYDGAAIPLCLNNKVLRQCNHNKWEKIDCSVNGGHCDAGRCAAKTQSCVAGKDAWCNNNHVEICYENKVWRYDPCDLELPGSSCHEVGDFAGCALPCEPKMEGIAFSVERCDYGNVRASICQKTDSGQYAAMQGYVRTACTESGEIASCSGAAITYEPYGLCRTNLKTNEAERLAKAGDPCELGDAPGCFGRENQLACVDKLWTTVPCPAGSACRQGKCLPWQGRPGESCNSANTKRSCANNSAVYCDRGIIKHEDCAAIDEYWHYFCTEYGDTAGCVMGCDPQNLGKIQTIYPDYCQSYGIIFYETCQNDNHGRPVSIQNYGSSICDGNAMISCNNNGTASLKMEQCISCTMSGNSANCQKEAQP